MLGAIDGDPLRWLGGVDLDSCRDPETGDLTPWATEIIERLASYTEVSPSRTGVKVFFAFSDNDLPRLKRMMDGKLGKSFSRGSHDEIAVYLGNRYFALTGEEIGGDRHRLCSALGHPVGDAAP